MDLNELLDAFIVEMLAEGLTEEQIATALLFEDIQLGPMEEPVSLLETVKRVRRKIGGINVTYRKTGRPNPLRSQKAKRAARAHKASRMQAMRRFQRSPKARQMRRVMARVRKTKPKRPKRPTIRRPRVARPKVRRPKVRTGYHGTRRHGPPRRATRPRVKGRYR